MIVFEDGIESLVNQIPAIDGFKPNFHWGDEEELKRWIALQEQPYPIIWLVVNPEEHDERGLKYVIRDCKFILATANLETTELNNVRLRGSYDKVLFPLADRLIEGITKFSITKLNNQKYKFDKKPNYSGYKKKDGNVDFWDAATIECSIRMNSNSQNTIIWQNE